MANTQVADLFDHINTKLNESLVSARALGMDLQETMTHLQVSTQYSVSDFERMFERELNFDSDPQLVHALYTQHMHAFIRGALNALSVVGEPAVIQDGQLYRVTNHGPLNMMFMDRSKPHTPVTLWPFSDNVFFRGETVEPGK